MSQLTHVDQHGQANMVDVSNKYATTRVAIAEGYISMSASAIADVVDCTNKKGDVLTTAKIAGIQAAKRCADLIPLCHPLALSKVSVELTVNEPEQSIHISAMCKLVGQTGVEMEALTAVSVTALTLFDMCKAADPRMNIYGIRVLEKHGGKSGDWFATDNLTTKNKETSND